MTAVVAMLLQRLVSASIEVTVLALLVYATIRLFAIRQPRVRALLWAIVIAKPIVTLLFGAIVLVSLPAVPALQSLASDPGVVVEETIETTTASAMARAATATAPAARDRTLLITMIVASLWLIGTAVAIARLVAGRIKLRRFIARAVPITDERVLAAYRRAAAALSRGAPPAFLASHELDSPAIVGTLKPIVVLPAWMVAEGVTPNMDWSLRHELMHWRLRDPWVAQLVELCRCLFFFHPIVFLIAKSWRDNSEMACDRELVGSDHDAREYAERLYEMLLKVRARRRTALAGSLFASRSQIGRRVEALLGDGGRPRRRAMLSLGLLSVLVLSVGADWRNPHSESADVRVEVHERGDGDGSHRSYRCTQTDSGGNEQRLRIEGRVSFTRDFSRIDGVDADSWLELVDSHGGHVRHVR